MKLVDDHDVTFIRKNCSNNELLKILRQFYKDNGRTPTQGDFTNNSKHPSFATYVRHFGSWNKALILSDLCVNRLSSEISDEELLAQLKRFYEENGRPPTCKDFKLDRKYPSYRQYFNRFGSWDNAMRLVSLDLDSMIDKGIVLENTQYRARIFELYVKDHFIEESIDLSGKNRNSPYDGVCPNSQTYDAKSAKFDVKYNWWEYMLGNMYREDIEWFYLGAFDKDFGKLIYVWRIPGIFIEGNTLRIGLKNNLRYNVENMKIYEITEKFDLDKFSRQNIGDYRK